MSIKCSQQTYYFLSELKIDIIDLLKYNFYKIFDMRLVLIL